MELSTLKGWLLCALPFQWSYYTKSQTCKDLRRTAQNGTERRLKPAVVAISKKEQAISCLEVCLAAL